MNTLTQINIKFLIFSLFLLLGTGQIYAQKNKEKFVLVLDAGHGGKDPGTRGVVKNEKYIALDITLKVGKLIEDYYKNDIKVIYTRKDDTFISLDERANIANRNNADLFVSIHCNAAHPGAKGTETYVLGTEPHRANANFDVVKRENSVTQLEDEQNSQDFDPSSPEAIIALTLMQNVHLENSLMFANQIEENFVNRDKRFSRGVKQAGFKVLWRTATPSVLIETGFISNSEEGRYLATEEGQKATAESIFEAFKIYKKEWDIKKGYNSAINEKKNNPKPTKTIVEPEKPVEGKTFKIQFLVSNQKYNLSAPQLKGLRPVEVVKFDNNTYKYFYGNTKYPSKRDFYLDKAKKAGFPDAFVVEINDKTDNNNNIIKKNNDNNTNDNIDESKYRILIFTSERSYRANAPQLKSIKNVDKIKENGLYKYYHGWYDTKEDAQKDLKNIQSSGFPNAYIVKSVNKAKK